MDPMVRKFPSQRGARGVFAVPPPTPPPPSSEEGADRRQISMPQIIKIKVIPHAGKNEIVGKLADGTLKIKLKAPPVDGKANEELVKFLAKEFGVKKDGVKIISGKTGRKKIIEIDDR